MTGFESLKTQGLTKFAMTCGSLALVGTMIIVVLSVIGRHIRIPLPGSVEIVELLIVIVATTSILYATLVGSHASARLFIDRLTPRLKAVIQNLGFLLGALFLLALVGGNIWLVIDYWSVHEASHLLEIPIIPFRLLFISAISLAAFVLLKRIFSKSVNNKQDDKQSND